MKNIFGLIACFCVSLTLFGQDLEPFYKSYDWEDNPVYSVVEDDSTDFVALKDKTVVEFFFDEKGNFTEYNLDHQILWVNSDQAIEENNKLYLPYSANKALELYKARVITKSGEVIVLDESKVLTAKDEESGQEYKYLTFEGLEKGSFIEYFYVHQKSPSYTGMRQILQSSYTKYNCEFDLYAPTNLVFELKSFNGLDEVKRDTLSTEKFRWNISIDTLALLEYEAQSSYDAERQFLIYKLDRNLSSSTRDISSYGQNAENIYAFIYGEQSKAEIKALKKLLKETGAANKENDEDRIRCVEDYVKRNIFLVEEGGDHYVDIASIIENKFANASGFIKLYSRLYEMMGIKSQMVVTCDRSILRFDPVFEASNFLQDYLLYFPSVKKYMAPDDITSRLGFPPPNLTNTYGLFVKEVALGDFKTGVGKIKFIDPIAYDKTQSNINVDVVFDPEDITMTKMTIENTVQGYYAMYLQTILHLLDEENTKELLESQVKYLNEDIELESYEALNGSAEDFGIKPFSVIGKTNTDLFVEKAGPKYLFKVGELIGPQMEMYQDKKRVLPVETEYGRKYTREISFNIPEGYTIPNIDDLTFKNSASIEGEVVFEFTSEYKVEGDIVTVNVLEFYTTSIVSPEMYEDYRKVINSAADFNKIRLIIEKK